MKVKCINNLGWEKFLTINKLYDISIDRDGDYWLIDDFDKYNYSPKELFKTVPEIRNETINKLLNES